VWPTPNVPNGGRTRKEVTATGQTPTGKHQVDLRQYVTDFFPSSPPAPPTAPPGPPSSPPGPTSPPLWQTPATDSFRSRGGERKDEQGLDQQARGFWPTPRREPGTHSMVKGKRYETSLEYVVRAKEDQKRRLNPRFVAWLMGLPPGWLDALSSCGREEMASYRSRLRMHLSCLLNGLDSTPLVETKPPTKRRARKVPEGQLSLID
jgi:hypothetical protein